MSVLSVQARYQVVLVLVLVLVRVKRTCTVQANVDRADLATSRQKVLGSERIANRLGRLGT